MSAAFDTVENHILLQIKTQSPFWNQRKGTGLYVVPGSVGFTLWCNFREENEVSIQTKLSETVFIDLFAFLSSIRGFPDD